jgi:hypothetical protein
MPAHFRVFLFLAVVGLPAGVSAQQTNETSAPPASTNTAGPRTSVSATAVRNVASAVDHDAAMQRSRQNVGKPVAMMIVGGAAIVVGAVIGNEIGTLFMIGGAVALLWGLYQYLK